MTDSATNPVLAAASWLEATLLGSAATALAVVAVAGVGLAMLTGRTDLRRAPHVLFGCFIIFGASTIAGGLRNAGQVSPGHVVNPQAAPSPAPPAAYPSAPASAYDPYAGAALPAQ